MKTYIRDGRRFRPIPNVVGMYWDGENWTKERNKNSTARYSRCYHQEGNVAYMVSLWKYDHINWEDAIKQASSYINGHLPSKSQVIIATDQCEELRKDDDCLYWTDCEYGCDLAWLWHWSSSRSFVYFYHYYKSHGSQNTCARLFFEKNL